MTPHTHIGGTYRPAGVFTTPLDRYPRLQVDYGRMPEHVANARCEAHQLDALAGVIGLCWPESTHRN